MPKCTTESWKMKDLVNALEKMTHHGKKIVIPRFQRGTCWSEKQELTFIDSLIKGYPVGTLLFYRTTDIENGTPIEVYTLVDGLQRSTAISRYMREPMKYYSPDNISDEMLTQVYDVLGFEGQEKAVKSKVKEIYFDYVKSLSSFDGENSFGLANRIASEISTLKDKMQVVTELMAILPKYLNMCKQEYNTIADTEIPAVVYTGAEEELPEIFSRINSKGTPLNPFEIYAASWPQSEKYEITNEGIIDHVLKKYDALNDDIYTIRGYDRSEISQRKRLTIFEYVFGFSKWLTHNFSVLAYEIKDKPDEITTIGFELLDACLMDSKNIGELHKVLKAYNINKLEKRIVEAIKYVEGIITPITRFKGNSRKNDHSILYAKNQIIAMIAFVFRQKYDLADLRHEKDSWAHNESKIREQLYLHFVFDILRKEWYEGGSKVHTVINNNRFFEEITPNAWESVLNGMFEDSLGKKEIRSVRNPSNVDIVFLNAIYVAKFSALDQLSSERFDIEHIATKALMKNLIADACPDDALEGLPIGSIANLCYLPEYQNRAKGSKTFYQDMSYLHGLTLQEIEEKYSFTTEDQLTWIDMDYDKGDFNVLQEFYLAFLNERFIKQKAAFYEAMHIDTSRITREAHRTEQRRQVRRTTAPATIEESAAGQEKARIYESIRIALEQKFAISLSKTNRTTVVSQNSQFNLTYSKMYPQGRRHKYWFAYHPEKVDMSYRSNYYVFACTEDETSFAIPAEVLEANKNAMNKSTNNGNAYYHVVLFVDTAPNGDKKMTWLLSRPEIREIDISEYKI